MKKIMIIVSVACLFVLSAFSADSCTVFRLKANDGSIIVGRSMEFAVDLKYDAVVVPRNKAYVSFAPGGKEGLSWKTRYGYVGIGSFGMSMAYLTG
jgi:choloylglycine hydrolase